MGAIEILEKDWDKAVKVASRVPPGATDHFFVRLARELSSRVGVHVSPDHVAVPDPNSHMSRLKQGFKILRT